MTWCCWGSWRPIEVQVDVDGRPATIDDRLKYVEDGIGEVFLANACKLGTHPTRLQLGQISRPHWLPFRLPFPYRHHLPLFGRRQGSDPLNPYVARDQGKDRGRSK